VRRVMAALLLTFRLPAHWGIISLSQQDALSADANRLAGVCSPRRRDNLRGLARMYYGYNQEDEKGSFVQWIIRDAGVYQACGPTVAQLPPGAYSCAYDNYGNAIFQSRRLYVDDLIDFTDSIPSKILHEIDLFWSLGDRFKKYGFLHRRGYLFYGKQGCGKSSIIHQVIGRIIAAGNLAFFCEQPNLFIRCMEQFRKVEPMRPMVCVFEDIDAIIATYGDSELLQWLDGNHQVDKAVNLASTNYPERLDRRIVSRPRRFDRILRIGAPDARVRAGLLRRHSTRAPARA